MRTNIIGAIFRKELREILRDKRMLFLVILMPFFLYPVLFTIMGSVGASQRDKMAAQEVTVLMNPAAKSSPFYTVLEEDSTLNLEIREFSREEVDTSRNTIGVLIPDDYQALIDSGQTAQVILYVDESKDLVSGRARRINRAFNQYNQQLQAKRLDAAGLTPAFINPVAVQTDNLASKEEVVGKALGSFLPMVILLFIFIGCVYISIDITAGEKERRTLQTIFTTPITTSEIISGKFLAVACVGIVSAAMNILSLVVAMRIQLSLLGEGEAINIPISIPTSGWIWLSLLIALSTLFIAAINLAVLLLANSYKEAQSYVTPLMMTILIPAILVTMPGWELNFQTALIPILNIVLALGEVLKGSPDPMLMGLVTLMALLYGLLALWFASRTFGNENVVTGEKVDLKSLLRG